MVDAAFVDWLHEDQRCAVHGYGRCRDFTVHHVRFCGSPKNDRRALGLCAALHMQGFGAHSIEQLGKDAFEKVHGISIEAEIQRYNEDYALQAEHRLQFSNT